MANGDSGRLRIVHLSPRTVLMFFSNRFLIGGDAVAIRFSKDAGLPDDCHVVSVNANWARRSIEAIVEHPSFDFVPEGGVIPEHPGFGVELEAVSIRDLLKDEIAKAAAATEPKSWRDQPSML